MPMRDIEELEEAELPLKYERGDYIDEVLCWQH
jgi:hypothetical protein